MIDLDFLERLIAAIDASGLDTIEIERGGTKVRLAKTPPAAPVISPAGAPPATTASVPTSAGPPSNPASPEETEGTAGPASNLMEVTSPMVGTFYAAPAPDAPPYVERGKRVSRGDTLCIIEAMKLMNELESEVDGTVAEVLVENGQPVEYGQVLFRVEPR
jgi:acetyl-CoA carboxylase biotin carboxyl carrier protein